MKKRLLITGLRAPVALDLARQFNQSGWQVIAADSQHLPIGRLSNALQSYHRLPAAAADHHAYADAVADLIQRERIDILLPTCEEAFFIARHKDKLSELCEVLTSDWQTMQFLHDKANVTEIVKGTDLNAPETQRVTNAAKALNAHQKHAGEIVLKKSFSRFARGVVIKPTTDDLARLNYTDNWISQQFITGQEYCVYGFALNGELKAFCAYRPTFRLGTASSYYFENVADPILQKFAQDVCRKHHIHGQISFDIIKTENHQYYLLECNPRATSAVHLFPATASLPQVFNDDQTEIITPPPHHKTMLALAMVLLGLPRAFKRRERGRWWRAWCAAKDALFSPQDLGPTLGQFLALGEGLYLAAKHRCDPVTATTFDTEWNGEPLD
ncbi:ATP-grasp domain-containing protein [Terasakiella pusilla]|uniref:ATP-grasp domain-containing protein n=1 Tax=Terasakiella pusilla TaxID=64973 RepID=UPI003AA9392D